MTSSQQSRFIYDVCQISAGKAGCTPGDHVQIHVAVQGLVLYVDVQDLTAAHHVGSVHRHLTVEAAGPQQGRVENVRPVGGGHNDDAFIFSKAVHFHQQLIQGLLAFIVTAAQTGAALPADGVDLIDENDAGAVLLGLLEQVADAGRADAHEHFHEIGTGNGEEGHAGLAGDGTSQQGLAAAGRSVQQYALGYAGADGIEFAGILQEADYLLQLLLHLIHPGYIGKGDLFAAVGLQLGPGFAELHHLAAAALSLLHQEDEQAHYQQHRNKGSQHGYPPAGGDSVVADFDVEGPQVFGNIRVWEQYGLEGLSINGDAVDRIPAGLIVSGDRYFLDLPLLHLLAELAV